jgi:hypothetical protein
MKFLIISLLSVAVLGCASSKSAARTESSSAALNDGYQVQFPQPPKYEQDVYQGNPLHRFALVSGNVTYSLSHTTVPNMSASFVGGSIKDLAALNGFELVSFEDITLANTQAAQSFVGKREKFTVNGIACGAGDRLYHVMTEYDAADAAQVAASQAFIASFKP